MHRRMELQRRLFSSFIGLAFVAAMAAALLFRFSSILRPDKPRLWMVEELAPFNGTDEKLPILLGILGSVFDVTKGKSHYGPGGGYHHFAGRDASRAFVSGNFTGKLFSFFAGEPTDYIDIETMPLTVPIQTCDDLVENVVDICTAQTRRGVHIQFLVRWSGRPLSDCSWIEAVELQLATSSS
ncbi:hypothetical protein IEQ34_004550 [Dendrobium chrysotoxum]|uniref:Chromo domain-containing protein n=1 Tax=Dendrobium chrysotoxum TaxID=161865 RepID=A0AAV7HHF0_DENCH|nr:hypothetical protein IEQ34_004550 [Dendrobium chrysotoxum]